MPCAIIDLLLALSIQNCQEEPLSLNDLLQWIDQEVVSRLSHDDIEHIHAVEMKIESAISSLPHPSNGAFIRLSTRSPKDAALSSLRIRELIAEGIASHTEARPDASIAEQMSEDLNIFTIASCAALKITTAQDAVKLLLHSQRVFDDIMRCDLDMEMSADSKDPEDYWNLKLVVREWWPHLFPPFEFRCFVYDDFMTAITQYYSLTYYPEVVDNSEVIRDMILDKWNEVHSLLHMHCYTIDFAISRDMDDIRVVEINQLPPVAGTSLFIFDDPSDRCQIERGYRDFDVRASSCENASNDLNSSSSPCEPCHHRTEVRVDEGGVLVAMQRVRSLEMRVNIEPLTSQSLSRERSALDMIDPVLRLYIDELRGRRLKTCTSSLPQCVDHSGARTTNDKKKNCAVM